MADGVSPAQAGRRVAGGGSNEEAVRRAGVSLGPVLRRDTGVDTHFNQRGRVSRLLTSVARNPQVLGTCIDKNTAVEVEPGVKFTVLGESAVVVFNGHVTQSSAPWTKDSEILALTEAVVPGLRTGYGFDLRSQRPVLSNGDRVPMPASGGSRAAELGTGG